MVKNPPSNAGDTGSIPGRGTKIPHAAGQLSRNYWTCAPQLESPRAANYRAHAFWNPHATITEPVHHNYRACMPQLERRPHTTTKIQRAATKTQCSQKEKEIEEMCILKKKKKKQTDSGI